MKGEHVRLLGVRPGGPAFAEAGQFAAPLLPAHLHGLGKLAQAAGFGAESEIFPNIVEPA